MTKKKVLSILCTCIVSALLAACNAAQKERSAKMAAVSEPATGDYAVIVDSGNAKYYLINDSDELSNLFLALSSAVTLKELPSHHIYIVENGMYKSEYVYYDHTDLYEEWDEPKPRKLISFIHSIQDTDHEVTHYTFYASDPIGHAALMSQLEKEDSYLFYYPSHDVDEQYSSIHLYYYCTDMSLQNTNSAPIGDVPVDDVLIPAIDYLQENDFLHKRFDVQFFFGGYAENPKYFGRKVKLLLTSPLNTSELDEIDSIVEESTSHIPYIVDNKPSENFMYSEVAQYPIEMISAKPISDRDIAAIKGRYGLE